MKRYLLDTHLIYWWMTADSRLGKTTQRLIAKSDIVVSVASLWEMALKQDRGKLALPAGGLADAMQAQGFVLLPILPRHIDAVLNLQCIHPDPFDRMLIAQTQDEKLTLLTCDAAILALRRSDVLKG